MSDLTGQVLSQRYQVEASIGRGGMAEVYKVWDRRRASYLAVKVLREDLAEDKIFLRRFRREAQTLSRLQHPNIVRFYGLDQDGLLAFMLMDFIEGTSLRREIFEASSPFRLQRVLEVMRAVCGALHYAHSEGVIHCDVKPGNILIEISGRVLVSDFGIARMAESATTTMVGSGTPAYMAPEQVRGESPTLQTDIYTLGIVLYEMLTGGERPFTGEQAQITGSTNEKVRWEQQFLPPISLHHYNPDIPKPVSSVVMQCLKKEPEKRYRNALELFSALQSAISCTGLAVTASQTVTASAQGEASGTRSSPAIGEVPICEPASLGTEALGSAWKVLGRRITPIHLYMLAGFIIISLFGTVWAWSFLNRQGSGLFALFATETPTQTLTISPLPTATDTATPTPTRTLVPTYTASSTPTRTSTPTHTLTPSSTPTQTLVPQIFQPTNTPKPTKKPRKRSSPTEPYPPPAPTEPYPAYP
jgi:serine/threonine protein kinase